MQQVKDTAKSIQGRRWSSRSVGTRLGRNIFYGLIRIGGRPLAYFSLFWVVLYYVLCRPSIRRKSDYYLNHRFPNISCLKKHLQCYRIFMQMGKILIDQAIVGTLGPEKMKFTIHGRQRLLDLVHKHSGFVLLMSHVGCWQVALSSLHFLKVPVNLLLEQEEGNIDRHYFEQAVINFPLAIIDPTEKLGGTLEMLRVLKKGEVLCMMGDRILGSEKNYLTVNFLGEAAPFPYSAFMVASAANAPIVIFFSYKTGYDTYALKISRIIRIPSNLGRSGELYRPYVEQYVKELEIFTQNYPHQFFNFYNMWHQMEPDLNR